MELAVSSELQASLRGLAGSYLLLMQINAWSLRAFTLLRLRFVVACQPLEEKDTEVHVREEIVIQSRGHIWMLNCLREGLTPLPFYRGRFSLLRLPSVLRHLNVLSLQCPLSKLLPKIFPALFPLPRAAHHGYMDAWLWLSLVLAVCSVLNTSFLGWQVCWYLFALLLAR